tara:strand:+ start:1655 stop:2320 length:666 start_codon:yes stop_codon:yes gene_type:complete
MNQKIVKFIKSKKLLTQSSAQNKPVIMSDDFSINRHNNDIKIMRETMLHEEDKKRRFVMAHSSGGPYKVLERVESGDSKMNRAYRVSKNSINNFVSPSLNSISDRKKIRRCNNKRSVNNKKKSVVNKKTVINLNKNGVKLHQENNQENNLVIMKKTVNNLKKKSLKKEGKKPASKKPAKKAGKKPASKKPTSKKPTSKKPASKKPTSKKPAKKVAKKTVKK